MKTACAMLLLVLVGMATVEGSFFNTFRKRLSKFSTGISNAAKKVYKNAKPDISNAADAVSDTVENAYKDAKSEITDVADTVSDTVENVYKDAKSEITDFADIFSDTVKEVYNDTVENVFKDALPKISDAANKMSDEVQSNLDTLISELTNPGRAIKEFKSAADKFSKRAQFATDFLPLSIGSINEMCTQACNCFKSSTKILILLGDICPEVCMRTIAELVDIVG